MVVPGATGGGEQRSGRRNLIADNLELGDAAHCPTLIVACERLRGAVLRGW
jgi:hypothetical protein